MSVDPAAQTDSEAQQRPTAEMNVGPRREFWLLVLTFLSFRLLVLFLFRPGGFVRDWSDFDTFLGIASLSDYGLYPFLDFWLEWPPLVPWLMVGAYRLSLLMPTWEDPRLWFTLILGTVFVLFEAGNFILIGRIAQRLFSDSRSVNRVLWLYAGLFPPVYAMLGFFDVIALFFLLLALELILAQRLSLVGVAIGVGFLVKLVPVVMLAVAFKSAWQRWQRLNQVLLAWLGILLTTIMTVVVLLLPFIVAAPQWLAAFGRAMVGRSAWETIWAVLEGYYGFGFVNGDRLNPAETNFAIYPPVLPWGIITLAFGVLYIFFFLMRADFKRPRHVTAFTGLTVVFFLLYSKGYSPQFLVYLLPFVLLLLPNLAGVTYALILTLLNVLEQPVYFVFFPPDQFPAMHWLLTVIVTARFVVWLALLIECLMLLDVWHAPVLRQGMRWLLAGSTIIGLLLLTPNLVGAYGQAQLTRSPYRSVINFLRTQATTPPAALLMTDQPLYTRLYPYLRFDYDLKLAGGEATLPTAPTTAQLLEGESLAWLLTGSDQGAVIVETMNGLAQPLSLYRFEDSEANLLLLYDVAGLSAPPTPLAVADTGIELLSYELDSSSTGLDLTLYWQTEQLQETNYSVFTQLLDSSGQLVSGHDGLPVNGSMPTTIWKPNYIIPDAHHIPLPSGQASGTYRLIVGMYDSNGIRLTFMPPGGEAFADQAIPLRSLTLQ